jgi:hypothetical protein
MKIGDYKQMMAYLTRPEQPKEQVADLVDDLTPGPLKDELTKDYDPSQESYEEYLQRKALGERPFNAQDGGRANLYAGGSLEKFASQIKDLHLKGISADKINEILKFEKDRSTTIDELIRSMIRGDAPITINAEELKRRPNLLGANKTGTPADRQEALKAYVDNFKKKNNRLPSKKELENAKFDFGTITKAVKSGNIEVLPSGQFLSMVKSEKGKQDILELSKDPEIRNIFKTGQFDTVNTINKVKEVLGDPNMSDNVAGTKIHTLAKYFSGEKSMKGINPTFRKNAELITEKFPYKEALRELGEIKIGESVGEQSLKTMKKNIKGGDFYSKARLSDLYNIDEVLGISSSVSKGTTPYGIFGQIIGREQNTKDKLIWDARKSKLEGALQEAIAKKSGVPEAVRNFNKEAKKYEEKLNAEKMRGAKKITLPRVSLASPNKTIANFKNFNNTYKEAFTDNFKQKGYSFIIPKDIKTLPELRDQVNDPKSSTYKQMINTLKKGFNEFDEKKLFNKINKATPDALKKIIKTIPRIALLEDDSTLGPGGYPLTAGLDSSIGVQPVEEDKSFVERNPITTGATVAASPLLTKTGRKIAKKFGKYALQIAGTPLGITGLIAGSGLDPKDAMQRVGTEAELALAPELVKQSAKFNPAVQRILNFGLSPAMATRAARIASPIGIASLSGEALYKYGKFVKDELGRIEQMSPEEREAYNIAEQEQMGVAAADGGLIRQGFKGGGRQDAESQYGADSVGSYDSSQNVSNRDQVYGGNNSKSDPDDNREQYGAQGQYQRPPSTPSDGGDNKINLINTLNKFRPYTFVNPYNYSFDLYKNIGPFGFNVGINTLGILGIDDPRTPEDESEQDDYGISAGFNTDLFGGTLGLGAGYSPTTGTNLGLIFSKPLNQGGRFGFADGPKNPGKRKTMKILAGLASLPILGRFFDVAQVAEKAAPAVVETFKNAPAHFIGLVNKIRALGRIIDPKKLLRYDKEKISNVYDYGDYRMYEKLDGGVEIQKEKFMGTDYGDAKVSEEYMSYNPKTPKFNKKGEKIPDEYEEVYEEYTAYPDSEGKMKDIYESVEPSTIDEGTYSKEELEQLIVEQIENNLKKGKEGLN